MNIGSRDRVAGNRASPPPFHTVGTLAFPPKFPSHGYRLHSPYVYLLYYILEYIIDIYKYIIYII